MNMRLPSLEKDKEFILPVPPSRVFAILLFSISQILILLSMPALARNLPSGLTLRALTSPSCPFNINFLLPLLLLYE